MAITDAIAAIEHTENMELIMRLTKDLKEAAKTLSPKEAEYMVKAYYIMQKDRITAGNQINALTKSGEPHEVLKWFFKQHQNIERDIKKVLDVYTSQSALGRWLKSVHGIGPVLSAGLMTYIDIHKAPTAGHIWSYAGLSPKSVWLSPTEAGDIVKEVIGKQEITFELLAEVCRKADKPFRNFHGLYKIWAAKKKLLKGDYIAALIALHIDKSVATKLLKGYDLQALDKLSIEDLSKICRVPASELDDALLTQKAKKLTSKDIIAILSLRPWNNGFKDLCWLIGDSFVKHRASSNCFYGHEYVTRKAYEWAKNKEGDYKGQCLTKLKTAKLDTNKTTYLWYSGCISPEDVENILKAKDEAARDSATRNVAKGPGEGVYMLPPSQIESRARRWATKLFLAHLHEVWYVYEFGKKPPNPYPIAILGHAHKIEVPYEY